MKTLILSLLALGLTTTLLAQNDMAMLNENSTLPDSKITIAKNNQYLIANNQTVKHIKILQEKVASFKVKDLDIYDSEKTFTYDVTFSEGKNKVITCYDRDGNILSSIENYYNTRLPYGVASKLIKQYPGWAFTKTSCTIEYNLENVSTLYKVHLKKDGKVKTLRITI